MVEQRSSKSHVWVRFLLSLFMRHRKHKIKNLIFYFYKKKIKYLPNRQSKWLIKWYNKKKPDNSKVFFFRFSGVSSDDWTFAPRPGSLARGIRYYLKFPIFIDNIIHFYFKNHSVGVYTKITKFNAFYLISYLKEVPYLHTLFYFFNYTYCNLSYLNFKFSKFFFIFTSTNYFYLNNTKFLNDVYSYYYQFLDKKKLSSPGSPYCFSKNFRSFKLFLNLRTRLFYRKNFLNFKNYKKPINPHFSKIYFFLKKIDNVFYCHFHNNFFLDKLTFLNLTKLNWYFKSFSLSNFHYLALNPLYSLKKIDAFLLSKFEWLSDTLLTVGKFDAINDDELSTALNNFSTSPHPSNIANSASYLKCFLTLLNNNDFMESSYFFINSPSFENSLRFLNFNFFDSIFYRIFQNFDFKKIIVKNYRNSYYSNRISNFANWGTGFNHKRLFLIRDFNFFLDSGSFLENLIRVYFNPFFFKLSSFNKNSTYFNNSLMYFNRSNLFYFIKNNFFYSNKSSLFFTNIIPSLKFFHVLKKKILKIFDYNKYPSDSASWHYNTIIRFIEFCTGKKACFRLHPFLNNQLDVMEKLRCFLWSQKVKYFRKVLGPRLFLNESIQIMYLSLKIKDPFILSNWMVSTMQKISFWKFKTFLRYLKYVIRYFFIGVFRQIGVRGIKFQLKGKVSVAGNARTRTVFHTIGSTSHSTFNNRLLYNLNLVRTFTGVIGLKMWIIF